ncbi:NADPH-ferrihemo reductase [Babesia ovis]|uniref:NADPH--hemoprotein reductase n=1 Tax=Babesia ovis TaxID=5869 RepID=A0A9W5TEI8_BABOV|nr:NADPH-ferrihemo reductase [Babesia ovis]
MSHNSRLGFVVLTSGLLFCIAYYVWNFNRQDTEEAAQEDSENGTGDHDGINVVNDQIETVKTDVSGQIVVYYASQTGTAEKLAKVLAQCLSEWNPIFQHNAVNLEGFEEGTFLQPGTVAIFMVSTHDDGLFPDNAERFIRWLGYLEQEGIRLEGLEFCIFGLGSTEYPLFNNAAKTLDRLLKKLGANELHRIKLGDDATDLKNDFEEWRRDLCWSLANRLGIESIPFVSHQNVLQVNLGDTWRDRVPLELRYIRAGNLERDGPPSSANVICKQQWHCVDHSVIDNVNMTPNCEGTTMCLTIAPESGFSAAETLNILYANPPEVVNYFMDKLNLKEQDLEKTITFVPRNATVDTYTEFEPPFPIPCTIGDALRYYLDLTGLPDEDTLRDMGTFLQSNQACQWFNKLFQRKALFKVMREELHITLQEFVEIFMRDAVFNLGGFLQIVPKKIPKAYTVSSHPKTNKIDLTIKLVSYRNFTFKTFKSRIKKELGYEVIPGTERMFAKHRMYKGACTHHLSSLKTGDVIKLYKRPSAFSLIPDLATKPLVMIANGSGIAPFRAMWQDGNTEVQRMLFLGFRDEEHILYKDEIEQLKTMPNYSVHIAFSRVGKRIYVQHLLRNHVDEIGDILQWKGVICVCGSKPMGAQVKAILQHFIKTDIEGLKARQQYAEELW